MMLFLNLYAFVVCFLFSSDIAGVKLISSSPTPKIITQPRQEVSNQPTSDTPTPPKITTQTPPSTSKQLSKSVSPTPPKIISQAVSTPLKPSMPVSDPFERFQKPSDCPVFSPVEESLCPEPIDECTDDIECYGLMRSENDVVMCCNDGCENKCVHGKPTLKLTPWQKNLKARQYFCPLMIQPRNDCPVNSANQCASDLDCVTDKDEVRKCCNYNGCEKKCFAGIKRLSESAAYCPPLPPAEEECPREPDHECLSDLDCHGLTKGYTDVFLCCIDGCEKRCIPGIPIANPTLWQKHVKAKEHLCPAIPSRNDCPVNPDHKCAIDFDCITDKDEVRKCCSDGCEFKCVAGVKPLSESAAHCPDPQVKEGFLGSNHPCSNDLDCHGFTKLFNEIYLCCLVGREKKCVAGIPIRNRTLWQKHLKAKEHFCPAIPFRSDCPVNPDHKCAIDFDCITDKDEVRKCCSDGCEFKCVAGVKTLSEEDISCTLSPAVDECTNGTNHECFSNIDCVSRNSPSDLYLCCRDGCDNKCVRGITKNNKTQMLIENKIPPTTSKQPKTVSPTQPKILNQTRPTTSKQPKSVSQTPSKIINQTRPTTSKQPKSVSQTPSKGRGSN